MSNLLVLCEKFFQSNNLYEVLGITKEASDKEVKKAYHKLSLVVHPDRVNDDDKLEATEKFKVLGGVHSILSDKEKRSVYDETGKVDDEDIDVVQKDWSMYWRIIFKTITDEDIRNYEKEYLGSDDELRDLKKSYLAGKGDMNYIVDHVQFARSDQEPRLRERIMKLIEDGEVPSYKAFTHEPEKKRKRRHAKENREAAEAEQLQKDLMKENNADDLALMIKQKQQSRAEGLDSFIDSLAAKYGDSGAKANKRKSQKTAPAAKKRKTRK